MTRSFSTSTRRSAMRSHRYQEDGPARRVQQRGPRVAPRRPATEGEHLRLAEHGRQQGSPLRDLRHHPERGVRVGRGRGAASRSLITSGGRPGRSRQALIRQIRGAHPTHGAAPSGDPSSSFDASAMSRRLSSVGTTAALLVGLIEAEAASPAVGLIETPRDSWREKRATAEQHGCQTDRSTR